MGAVVGRTAELSAIGNMLDVASREPAALVLEGDAGIGKTTLLRAGVEIARERLFWVLWSSPAAAEVRLAYAGLTDLLSTVGDESFGTLSAPMRQGLDAALLRGDEPRRPPSRRAVAAAFLAVVEHLAAVAPVVIAIDDLQWLDGPSAQVLEFAVRRLSGRVGILAARRVSDGGRGRELVLQHSKPVARVAVGPLGKADLNRLVRARVGRALPRPVSERINQVAAGNPFFALEIAAALPNAGEVEQLELPESLLEVVRARVKGLGPPARGVLLAASALARPTVEAVKAAMPELDVAESLEQAEDRDVAKIAGGLVQFTHPLLASGVYAGASRAQRRAMHLRLSKVVDSPEERARHLALATVGTDPAVVSALDQAAVQARLRGAPSAAAELLELALRLGADSPERRVRAAEQHFDAGAGGRARELLRSAIAELDQGPLRARALSLLGTITYRDDSQGEAVALFEQALEEAKPDSAEWIETALELSFVLANQVRVAEALPIALAANTAARRLGDRGLLAQTLMVSVTVQFMLGRGLDERGLQEALVLEDAGRWTFAPHRPSMLACLVFASVGRLDEAWAALIAVRERCLERGEDGELIYTTIHAVQLELWRGRFADAVALAEDAYERALQLDTSTARGIALWAKAAVAAWSGDVAQARALADESLALFMRTGSTMAVMMMPLATLGLLDVSLGDYEAAAARLAALAIATAQPDAATDPTMVPWVADAVEALVGLGRTEEAAPIVDWLEDRGQALDRAWALAIGGRCRGLMLAAAGDLAGAEEVLGRALAVHDRLPLMSFERARTLLVLGAVQRRLRKRRVARATLSEAAASLERLGASLWASRARDELQRLAPRRRSADELTDTELRVAQLAASGMTNREVGAALFISSKTVEANLARIYRKLGIRSRAELGRQMMDHEALTSQL